MPDEVKTDEEKPVVAPAPVLDAEALGKQIAEAARGAVREAIANQPAEREPQPVDALEEVIAPYVQKATGRANLLAALAADKADFYTIEDAEDLAERLHFKEEIEKRTLGNASVGRALPRIEVFRHLKGEQEAKVAEFRGKRKKAREDRVRNEGQDEGGGALPREGVRHITVDHAYDLQAQGKLDESLADKAF